MVLHLQCAKDTQRQFTAKNCVTAEMTASTKQMKKIALRVSGEP